MTVRTMRLVDCWLGVPLCALLTIHRRLCGRLRRPLDKPRRIVLIKLAEQGSTVLAYAAIRRAIEMVGKENVFFLVFQENRFILDQLNIVPLQNVIAIPTGGIVTLAKGLLAAMARMRREKIDAAVDFEFFARSSAALGYLSGASQRAGFHPWHSAGPYRGDLMTHRLSYNPHLHASETFISQVEALNVDPCQLPAMNTSLPGAELIAPTIEFSPRQVDEVKAIVQRQAGGALPSQLVLLNPNCSDLLPLRMWPRDRYLDLARRLLAKYPRLYLAFTGAPEEEKAADKLVVEIGSDRCFSMAGKTTLGQLLVLYSLATVLVTNDSGPAHFATMTPVEVVTLFGPETPKLFAARTNRNHVCWSGIPCSPCVNAYNNRESACKNNLCMKGISVQQVFDEVCAILNRGTTD